MARVKPIRFTATREDTLLRELDANKWNNSWYVGLHQFFFQFGLFETYIFYFSIREYFLIFGTSTLSKNSSVFMFWFCPVSYKIRFHCKHSLSIFCFRSSLFILLFNEVILSFFRNTVAQGLLFNL